MKSLFKNWHRPLPVRVYFPYSSSILLSLR